jgi:pyrroloquinoline-quinone synthase
MAEGLPVGVRCGATNASDSSRPGFGVELACGMNRTDLDRLLAEALRERRLLDHPFYQRWQAGELVLAELASYAEQYRHFEKMLPDVLTTVASSVGEPARTLLQANLDDELGNPVSHLALFDQFAEAVGADTDEPPTAATDDLVELYRTLAITDPPAAVAALAAYEVQSAGIARSKSDGLKSHYGLGAAQTEFWELHSTTEVDHANWTLEALALIVDDAPAHDLSAVELAADAWWAFLDERQANAPESALR